MAIFNVLLPKYDQANQPQKISFLTTLYVTAMGISTAIASYLSVPITQASSWKGSHLVLSFLCLVTLLVWLPNHHHNHRLESQEKQVKENILKDVWAIIIFGGLQSLLTYKYDTWLPTMAVSAGISNSDAALLASIFSLISIPFSDGCSKSRRLVLRWLHRPNHAAIISSLLSDGNCHALVSSQ